MSNLSAVAMNAREAVRNANGKFGAQQFSEGELVDLRAQRAEAYAAAWDTDVCPICKVQNLDENMCPNCKPECGDCCGCYTFETAVDLSVKHGVAATAQPIDYPEGFDPEAGQPTHEVVDRATGRRLGVIYSDREIDGQREVWTVADVEKEALEIADSQDASKWGRTGLTPRSRTPWGPADHLDEVAPGICSVSTPGHGGIKLNAERNAGIPAGLRNSDGWYEEDCEAHIVSAFYPESSLHWCGGDRDKIRAESIKRIRDYYPDQWEKFTGETIPVEESYAKRQQAQAADLEAFKAAHKDDFIATGSAKSGNTQPDSTESWIPAGMRVVTAKMESTGEQRSYLVSEREAVADHMIRRDLIIDPKRHVDVTDIATLGDRTAPWRRGEAAAPIKAVPNYGALTASQASRAKRDLESTRYSWTMPDGSQQSMNMSTYFQTVGVTAKKESPKDGGGFRRFVTLADGSGMIEVSQAVYKSLDAVPDATTSTDKLRAAANGAEAAYFTAREASRFGGASAREKEAATKAKMDTARAALKDAQDKDDVGAREWRTNTADARKAALATLADAKGLTFGGE